MVSPILIGLGTIIFRNVTGWFKNSAADKKITKYELGQLLTTTISVGAIYFATYYGLGQTELVSAAAAYLGDLLLSAFKSKVAVATKK